MLQEIRKFLRPVRQFYHQTQRQMIEAPYRRRRSPRGTARWLIESEVMYGGYVERVPRLKVSPHDPRGRDQLAIGGMIGGDRMLFNRYAGPYSRYLSPFLDKLHVTLAEIGILRGTGLAIWCDLFPNGRVLGFDIDLAHFGAYRPELERRGAFKKCAPEVFEFDQLAHDGSERLGAALGHSTLDVVIDDGFHAPEPIVNTWRAVLPFLSERFVYFIEDYSGLLSECGAEFAGYDCEDCGALTVISRGVQAA